MKDEAREKQTFDVFLSHNSKDKPAVRALAALLTERDISVWFDEEQQIPGRPWQTLLEKGIKESATGAVLVGADGLGPWENEEMQGLLQFAVEEKKPVIPVLLPGAPEKPDLPLFLRNRGWVDLRAGFGTEGMDKLIWGITGEHPGRKPVHPRASEPIIAVTRLRHGADRLVGREKELARLDTAWHDPKTHVVTIVAWGGVGKTALVVEWMARMARDGWRGAERVFDWSFYSQGTREQGAASADTFIAKALEFFGDPEMAKSAAAAWDKGSRLAQLVAHKRTLLVLDGVEPLQYPPGPVGGKLKDPGLEALLKGLAQKNPGLCIVTTRESVTDLKPYRDTTSPEWLLEHLSEEAGAHLLFETGVKRAGNAQIRADDKELKDAAREVRGHALTLQLLGRYLAKVHNGDVRKRDLVRFEKADAKVQGGHAFKVMAVYEKWLGEGGEDALRQLAVLRLLGLFDRPADGGCLAALREEPAIAGLTEPLVGLNADDWNYTLSNLVECGLISCHEDPSQIDCHPLIREYFAKRVRDGDFWFPLFRWLLSRLFPRISVTSLAWRAAHRRLYEHLCATTTDKKPQPTLEDLQPLYQAVAHGCQGGLHEAAFWDVYWLRICRGELYYPSYHFGPFASDVSTLALFVKESCSGRPIQLRSETKALIFRGMGYALRPLGRIEEAIVWMKDALTQHERIRDWRQASTDAGILCVQCAAMGRLTDALVVAEKGVKLSEKSNSATEIFDKYGILGEVLLQLGRVEEARLTFEDMNRIQDLTDHPRLSLIRLYACYRRLVFAAALKERYCGDVRWAAPLDYRWKIDSTYGMAIQHLCHAIAREYDVFTESFLGHGYSTKAHLDESIQCFRVSARFDAMPLALLERASWHCRVKNSDQTSDDMRESADIAGAQADLDEAWEIAKRGPMRLHMADIHLYRARLFHAVTPYPWDKDEQGKLRGPKDDLAAARKLIEQCGYHRRDEELADAEEAAKSW